WFLVATEADALAVSQRHHPELAVRPAGAVVVLDDVGDVRRIGRYLHGGDRAQLQQIAALQPALRMSRRRRQSNAPGEQHVSQNSHISSQLGSAYSNAECGIRKAECGYRRRNGEWSTRHMRKGLTIATAALLAMTVVRAADDTATRWW